MSKPHNQCETCPLRDIPMSEGAKFAAWKTFAIKREQAYLALGRLAQQAVPPISPAPQNIDTEYLNTVVERAPERLKEWAALIACFVRHDIHECPGSVDYQYARADFI